MRDEAQSDSETAALVPPSPWHQLPVPCFLDLQQRAL
jgi:hypothetical protein